MIKGLSPIAALVILVSGTICWFCLHRASSESVDAKVQNAKSTKSADRTATNELAASSGAKLGSTQQSRLTVLESMEKLPDVPRLEDWELAPHTSWWGKPLDAEKFWADRVRWLDDSTVAEANRHGRFYPPIPPGEDIRFVARVSAEDVKPSQAGGLEAPGPRFRYSEREAAFWDFFGKSHPRPTEFIEQHQFQVAEIILNHQYDFQSRGNPLRTTAEGLTKAEGAEKRRVLEMGVPSEALTQEALFWAFVTRKRKQFQLYPSANSEELRDVDRLRRLVPVDPKFITQPLGKEQLNSANVWKNNYIKRLQQEKADPSYINAYIKAWNLQSPDVVHESKEK